MTSEPCLSYSFLFRLVKFCFDWVWQCLVWFRSVLFGSIWFGLVALVTFYVWMYLVWFCFFFLALVFGFTFGLVWFVQFTWPALWQVVRQAPEWRPVTACRAAWAQPSPGRGESFHHLFLSPTMDINHVEHRKMWGLLWFFFCSGGFRYSGQSMKQYPSLHN